MSDTRIKVYFKIAPTVEIQTSNGLFELDVPEHTMYDTRDLLISLKEGDLKDHVIRETEKTLEVMKELNNQTAYHKTIFKEIESLITEHKLLKEEFLKQ